MTAEHQPIIGSLAAHAAEYARQGLLIFPVNEHDKSPLVSQHNATTDAATVEAWWRAWPTALIGCRIPADLVVLDVDPRHGGDRTWQAIKAECDGWPETRAHKSGRGDGGGHTWWLRPEGHLNVRRLNEWAKARGLGHEVGGGKWTAGVDILQHDHRYTILPPSPHPETGAPYEWLRGGLKVEPAKLPDLLAHLVTDDPPLPQPASIDYGVLADPDSIVEWFNRRHSWPSLLGPHGWRLVGGDGEGDGSAWRHPTATSAQSATIRGGRLYNYSPNTPFEVTTGAGDRHGYSKFDAYAMFEHGGDRTAAARAARYDKDATAPRIPVDANGVILEPEAAAERPPGPQRIIWAEFWAADEEAEDWLAYPLLPKGRQVALWATHKTGKSLLALEVAAALATGRPVLGQPAREPMSVVYVDMEMSGADLRERLTSLGYDEDVDLDLLTYYLLQDDFRALDTAQGGQAVIDLCALWRPEVVIFDTMARVVQGEENSADTYRAFYRFTGLALKAMRVAVLRLDHGGKDPTKGQRGSSGKGDDVDVVWRLSAADGENLTLNRTASRMAWVPEVVLIHRETEPFTRHVCQARPYAAGAAEVADWLVLLGAPPDVSQRAAQGLLKDAGHKVGSAKLRDGVRAYKDRLNNEARAAEAAARDLE